MPPTDRRREILEQVKVLVRRDLKLGPDIEVTDDMPFFGSDVDLDSLDILLLLTSIEKQFKLRIPSEAVGREVFRNVSTLADYIETHGSRPAANGAAAAQTAPGGLELLPHRDPFRFVSKITQMKPGESGEGVWSVVGTEPFFEGHFPGHPLVPGVLIAEALAQLSGVIGAAGGTARAGKLAHVDVRFDESVAPPAEIILRSRQVRSIGDLRHFEVTASVGTTVVARGDVTLSLL